jgi:uncharacterized surface protein with fasciclin (FAS1) repeats
MLTHRTPLTILAALTLLAPAAVRAQEQQQQPGTVIDVLEKQGNYATFLRAIRAAGLEETFRGTGPFTIFAPTDEAFAKLPEGKLDALIADPEALKDLISYHAVAKPIATADVTEPMNVKTLQGSVVRLSRDGERLRLQAPAPAAEVTAEAAKPAAWTANVVSADMKASNGVVHAIDRVLDIGT